MRIGFSNYTPQRTNFKGLFAVVNKDGQKEWVNTDHFVKCKESKDTNNIKLFLTNDIITLDKNSNDIDKILKNYSMAAVSKDAVIDQDGKDMYTKGIIRYIKK